MYVPRKAWLRRKILEKKRRVDRRADGSLNMVMRTTVRCLTVKEQLCEEDKEIQMLSPKTQYYGHRLRKLEAWTWIRGDLDDTIRFESGW